MSIETDAMSLVGWPEVLIRLRRYFEESGLQCSKYLIDHSGNTPSHLVSDTFSLDVQTASDDVYRDVTPLRAAHTVGVTIVTKVAPANDQFKALTTELGREEAQLRRVLPQANTAEIRTYYVGTSRTLSPSREYLIVRHTLRAVHDWYGEPLE